MKSIDLKHEDSGSCETVSRLHRTDFVQIAGLLMSLMVLLDGLQTARAFTSLDQASAWSAWTNAFYYTDSSGFGYFRSQEGTGNSDYIWQFAQDIEVVDRAAQIGLATPAMVNAACCGFTNVNGVVWSWDTWNDDVGGATRAFVAAYEITGNSLWLNIAKTNWDLAYNRGYVADNGGMDEFVCTTNCLEATETADGVIWPAYRLYVDLPNSSYLTKAQGLYTYLTNYVFVPSTGEVKGAPGGGSSSAPADYGMFMMCAQLFNDTNSAMEANSYLTNNWGIFLSGTEGGAPNYALEATAKWGVDTSFALQSCDNAWSWQNSRGLVPVWLYRQNDSVPVVCYDAMQLVMAMMWVTPAPPETLPVSVSDVVGSQVTFSAAFPSGWSYQWQFVSGGATNNIPGATSMTLTLNNLQVTNSGAYQLMATNGSTIQVSAPAILTVSNPPAAVSNVIASCACQTGRGYGYAFTPTWSPPAGSLLSGVLPTNASGNFNLEPYYSTRSVNSLTSGGSLTVTPEAPNYPLPSLAFVPYTVSFTATASTETLSFIGLDPYGAQETGPDAGQTVFIDDVSVTNLAGGSVTVPNYNFQTPVISDHQYDPSGASWTFSGSGPTGSGIEANGGAFGATNAPNGGTQAAFIQGHGVVYQSISGLIPGDNYVISYYAAQRSGYLDQSWLVTIGDLPTPAGTNAYNYTNYSITFTAMSPTQTLAFVGTALVNSGNTVFIDNVSITAAGGGSVTVPDFSFETPVVSDHQYNPIGTPWTFGGTSGIMANGSAFGNPTAPDGVQAAFLQGNGTISQAISGFTPGTSYTITFDAAQRSSWNTGGQTWNVTMNGAVIGNSAAVLGSRVLTGANYVTCGEGCGAGSNIVYNFGGPVILTNVTVYGGWATSERDAQAFKIYYSTASAPGTFILLASVNYNPVNTNYNPYLGLPGTPAATRVTLTPASGVLASNVMELMFAFTNSNSANDPGNSYCGYAQIAAYGTPSGVTIASANQTGSASTYPFTPSWSIVTNGDLLFGLAPTSSAGNFSEDVSGRNVNSLTAGGSLTINQIQGNNGTTCSTNYVTCGNGGGAGSNIIYALNGPANGYNITNITVYGGWQDNGRDQQAYTIYYSTVASPTNFIALTSVNYTPSVPANTPSATKITISSPSGLIAGGVAALEFNFTSPASENGYCGYAQIAAYGNPTGITTATTNQTGLANTYPFTPSWSIVTNGDLLFGLVPTSSAGNFSEDVSGRNVNSLTAGGSLTINQIQGNNGTTCSTNYVTCGNGGGAGSNIIYTLNGSPNGYTITNITVYGGWQDNGRDQQAYTVYYSTASSPSNFIALTSVNYTPSISSGMASATRVTIAANSGIIAYNVVALEFNFTSPASENGYCGYAQIAAYGTPSGVTIASANQTGSASTYPFTPSWSIVTNGDLLFGLAPSSSAGNFSEEVSGRNVNSLTAGGSLTINQIQGNNGTTCSTNYVTCGNGGGAGSNIIYALNGPANGYNITNITVYGGWQDNGRDQQAYTIYYSTVASPTNFIALTSVNYTPSVPANTPSATKITISSPSGLIAGGVAALEFNFTSPASENGYCGYAQIAAYGTANPQPFVTVAPPMMTITVAADTENNFVMNITGMLVGKTYEVQSTTNLASKTWTTETNFVAETTSITITNAIQNSGQEFYRIIGL